ncbi:thermonuclease family protein [Chloroflexota bacterium]
MVKKKVQKIIDGDTFVTSDGKKVRLANVNAPEKGKNGAPKAKKDLVKIISGQSVNVEEVAHDKYGRIVAKVQVDGKSVNKKMREKGWK